MPTEAPTAAERKMTLEAVLWALHRTARASLAAVNFEEDPWSADRAQILQFIEEPVGDEFASGAAIVVMQLDALFWEMHKAYEDAWGEVTP